MTFARVLGLVGRSVLVRCLGALVVLVACAACDGIGTPPPDACVAFGTRCQLPGGPVGVCQETACAAGGTPPCFVCTPQH